MLDALQGMIRRLLRVPPEPEPPLGDPRSVRIFRAGRGFYRYRLAEWGLRQAATFVGLVVGLAVIGFLPEELPELVPFFLRSIFDWTQWIWVLEALAIAAFLVQLPFTYLLLVLDYRYRWYVTTDRSLRIREGIWRVQERTMSFSNVQNLGIRQGPVQRLFGIADLKVQTAGGGGQESGQKHEALGDNLHVGYFRGVDNAEEIRDGILGHLRRLRAGGTGAPDHGTSDSGLGDPEESFPVEPAPAAEPAATGEVLAAAREVLRETRALRGAIAG